MKPKSPPSQMLRVPTILIPAIKELSRLHREGHTGSVLHGLQELIDKVDSDNDSDFAITIKTMKQLEERLKILESQVKTNNSAVSKKLEILETALTSGNYRHQNNRRKKYQTPVSSPELQPYACENLAQRLGVSVSFLVKQQKELNPNEFLSWLRNRDPMGRAWKYSSKDNLYHPVK